MSNAAGETPDGFHLVSLAKLFLKPHSQALGLFARGDVLACADEFLSLLVFIKQPFSLTEKQPNRTIRTHDAFFCFKGGAITDALLDSLPGEFAVFGMNAFEVAREGGPKLFRLETKNSEQLICPAHGVSCGQPFITSKVCDLLRICELDFAHFELFFNLFALGDIQAHAAHTDGFAPGIVFGLASGHNPVHRTIGPDHAEFDTTVRPL